MGVRTQPDDKSTAATRAVGTATAWLGSFPAILLSVAVIVVWFVGIVFVPGGFSNNAYQLLINTGTTVVTFLMVFIIQNTQNRDGRAMQTKLDAQSEVLRAMAERLGVTDDDNLLTRLVGVEDAPEREIRRDQDEVRDAAKDQRTSAA
jgi:low affinity Fe/Cu permease